MSAKIDHVNLTVRNLEESVEWYKKIFGFEKLESGISEIGKKWAIVGFEDSMIAMSEHAQRSPAIKLAGDAHRIYHFGLRIPDANEWRLKVRLNNLKLKYGGEVEYPFSRSWYIQDPSGHEIEVSCTNGLPLQFPVAE